ncbi:MAG TPA: MFS transporter [Anaerolineales bacterium]|nr:MFS transporter [Anaerolineales bacterium]
MQTAALENSSGRLAKTAGYYIAFIVLGLSTAALGPTLPGLAEQTRSTLSQVSYLFSARSLGYLLGSLWGGRLYDRLPGQRVMVVMLLIMASALALMPGIPVLWLLAGVLWLLGVGEGALDVGANTLIVWVHREKVGPFMNGLHFFFGIGAFLSPVIFAQAILLSGGIAWGYRLLALSALPIALYTYLQASPARLGQMEDGSLAPIKVGRVLVISLFFALAVGLEGAYSGWVYTYARQLNLADAVTAAYLTAAFWGAFTVGRLLGIPLSMRFQPGKLILADVIGCLLSLAVILIWPGSRTALWLGTLGLGASIASIFPNTMSFAGQQLTITGRVTSLFFVGTSLGGMLGPWLVGQLIEPLGPLSVIWALEVISLLALGVYAWLIASPRRAGAAP